jgi:2-C-methyl-D-erythritol 2,4-cyclodiphosphate synthase
MRVGIGYDVHPLTSGRKLTLGGIEIQFNKGLSGHSDADALTHAIIDALLGAAGLKDIGSHFPSEDESYKDISSLVLLGKANELVIKEGFKIGNIDATVVAQKPKLAPFIDDMRVCLSQALGIEKERLMIKATTTEGLGFAGKGEGIAAYAVVLLEGGATFN